MPITNEQAPIQRARISELDGAGGELLGEPPGVPGMAFEIGGVSPVLEP